MITTNSPTTSHIFLVKGLGECTFELGSGRVDSGWRAVRASSQEIYRAKMFWPIPSRQDRSASRHYYNDVAAVHPQKDILRLASISYFGSRVNFRLGILPLAQFTSKINRC